MKWILKTVFMLALFVPVSLWAQGIQYTPSDSRDWTPGAPVIWDDFLSGASVSNYVGALGWYWVSAAGSGAFIAGETNHPGIFRVTVGAAGAGNMYTNGSTWMATFADIFSSTYIVRIATGANPLRMRIGPSADPSANPPADGVYFEHLQGDTNWFAVTRGTGAETRTDTGIAFAANTWLKLDVEHPIATSYTFKINGVVVATNTTHLPAEATGAAPGGIGGVATGTQLAFDIDYFRAQFKTNR